MDGDHTSLQQLFFARSTGTNYHLFPPGQNASLCGCCTIPETPDGRTNRQKLHRFDSFDTKPDHKWCNHCQRVFNKAIDQ